jgi:uncharacterized protein YaaQ
MVGNVADEQRPIDRLIFAIVQDFDADRLLSGLSAHGFRATRVASTGGYLRAGNSTLLLGVPAAEVPACLALLSRICQPRLDRPLNDPSPELTELYASGISHATIGGGVAFIAAVSRHERFD